MQTTTSLKQDKSNIDPQRMHRQQRFWQIIFPVSIVGVALVAGMVYLLLTAGATSGDVAGLAQTATVILTLPLLLMLLPILMITIALIILLGKLAGWLPKAGVNVFEFSENVRRSVRKSTSAAVTPLFFIQQKNAELQQLIHSIHPKSKGERGL